ncbi:RNA-directed DNA polymerase from mobile element jockey [Plakobranchus ocellatus]|uniref:RNA-directed DNA polymerase from mobile element jockey n=1 Tax=Plakobranchus ocellatus TaxID=259542 RepID=A0AAV4AAR1_9GAST|nr:RNA-directed DNA polymerase from mobile element jockey [Plakobranchus ocellatus]
MQVYISSSQSLPSHMESGIESTHRTRSHTLYWGYSSRVALTQRWNAAQRVHLVGFRGGRGALELNYKTLHMTQPPYDPSPHPDVAKKPCIEATRGAASVASKRKAEDLPTLMSVSPFASWSPFTKFMLISSKGSAKVADRSPFKIHRELKSILGDETIEVTKLGSGDLMVELKSNDQAKKLGAIATFLDIPVTVSPHKRLNSSKGVIRSCDLWCCSEEEMVEELSGVTHARRIKVRRGEDKIQTDIVVLTFDSPKLLSRIRAGYLTLDVRPYVPLPMRSYKCQRYGHGKDRCKKPAAVCVRCGKGGHGERDCSADPHCVNCRGDHAASGKTCPKFLEEQAILRYKAENGGTFQQAREKSPEGFSGSPKECPLFPLKPQSPSKSRPPPPAEKPQGPPPSPSPPYPFTPEVHVTEGVKQPKKIKGLADQSKGGLPSNKKSVMMDTVVQWNICGLRSNFEN